MNDLIETDLNQTMESSKGTKVLGKKIEVPAARKNEQPLAGQSNR